MSIFVNRVRPDGPFVLVALRFRMGCISGTWESRHARRKKGVFDTGRARLMFRRKWKPLPYLLREMR